MILVKDLKKSFIKDGQEIEVLKGFNLEIARGESLAMLGVSGAGKSTFIHILGTLDHPTSGTVLFDGVNVFDWQETKIAEFRNRKIGFVFQFHHLLPEFNALENTMMPGLISGMQRMEAADRAGTLLEEVGLGHRIKHKPGELSGGEQQRVAFARALMMEPEIVLADEPTGNLDSETGRKVYETMLGLNQSRNITLVVVTHNRTLAGHMSRRIELEDGKITHSE
ncbi:MAG TPA: ABC transporter ATP-binding protein [Syntrophales bacterium]|nr:ABC transporter ATP-binding protein [Syntrophales bacterium]HOX93669.1 ABC transporter ATP-binding protein [Syntrophales bacterium]HPI57369.1 ABC transporter ATP-binding protein [Syntrophales bacterium]HPN25433.1 ABC transporter ATP-binding protein [Syntrophales bacterium]HQM29915.1 ABC transporter ATP-binding protein [Syntrophales bacterium]